MLAMHVVDVTFPNDQSANVFLVEDTQHVRLKFWTTHAGGEAILAALQKSPAVRPPAQAVLLNVLQQFDIQVRRTTIDELRDGLLYAHLELQSGGGKNVTVEALPSDAVTVTLRAGVPLEVSEQVVAAMGSCQGQLVEVGGHQLSAHVKGNGGPVVVLEASFGGGYQAWSAIRDSIAEFTTVCSYDRAGLGWSGPAPAPRTFRDSVRDLHTLLERLALPAPYVLVGHSIGGTLMLLFATTYPADAAGLVLVDSAHPDGDARFLAAVPPEKADDPISVRTLRKNAQVTTLLPEWEDAIACYDQVDISAGLGNLPLTVITATKRGNPLSLPEAVFERQKQVWFELQADLARLSSRSMHRFAEQSGHMVPLDQPEIVIDTIREMVETTRQHEVQSQTALV